MKIPAGKTMAIFVGSPAFFDHYDAYGLKHGDTGYIDGYVSESGRPVCAIFVAESGKILKTPIDSIRAV